MANKPILSPLGLKSRTFEQKCSTLMGSEEVALGVGLTLLDDVSDFDGLPWIAWFPPQTTVPPLVSALRAAGTRAPTGAKIMDASSLAGGRSSELRRPSQSVALDCAPSPFRRPAQPGPTPSRPFPRQSSCAHDGNSGLGGVHFASPVAIGFDEQFNRDRTQTRTRTRTSRPFLAWVGFSRLRHACIRSDKLPGGKTGQASPIPTLASIRILLNIKPLCESNRATRTQMRTCASSGL